jgi:Predicted hydrolase of the alpha/beta-hydrolase fold
MANSIVSRKPPGAATRSRSALLRKLRRAWAITGATVAVLFVGYQAIASRASGPAPAALESTPRVRVTRHATHWRFEPATGTVRDTGLLFLPGSVVDPAAYAPLAQAVADRGYPVEIVLIPFRVALTEGHRAAVVERARAVLSDARQQGTGAPSKWVVAGHSLGGALSARFARDHADLVAGLVLIGTSHPREYSLAPLTAPVTKVYATNDGLASPGEVRRYAVNLPPQTRWVEIMGGNHSQFGWYGFQVGDHKATIGHAEQQAQLAEAVLSALEQAAAKAEASSPSR